MFHGSVHSQVQGNLPNSPNHVGSLTLYHQGKQVVFSIFSAFRSRPPFDLPLLLHSPTSISTDTDSLTRTWKVCTKVRLAFPSFMVQTPNFSLLSSQVAAHLEQGKPFSESAPSPTNILSAHFLLSRSATREPVLEMLVLALLDGGDRQCQVKTRV